MFCDLCGRDIAGDSRYCAYCGSFLEKGAPEELDWEEAAHRREALEEAKDEKSSTLNGTIKNSRLFGQPGTERCTRPNAPKKKCVDCGKELPSGGMEERCTMCVIRLRNRDLEQQRERQDSAPFRGDRYDKSDAFDQKVFEGVQYFREEKPPKSDRKKNGRWKIILVIMLLIFGFPLLSSAFYFGSSILRQVEKVGSTLEYMSMDVAKVFPAEAEADEIGHEIYNQYINPYVQLYLDAAWNSEYPQGYLVELSNSYENFRAHGIYNEIEGLATFVTHPSEGREEIAVPYFISFVLMQDGMDNVLVDVVRLELGEYFSFDLIPYMDSDGFISAEGEEALSGTMKQGDLLFDYLPIPQEQWGNLL